MNRAPRDPAVGTRVSAFRLPSLAQRRVLSAWECCDDYIERALKSLQEIREFLIEKEVELSDFHDGPLFLLVDMMATGIRQFLTFEQRLSSAAKGRQFQAKDLDQNFTHAQQHYFDGLEIVRDHLSHCLRQVAVIADMKAPANGLIEKYRGRLASGVLPAPALPKPESTGNAAKTAK